MAPEEVKVDDRSRNIPIEVIPSTVDTIKKAPSRASNSNVNLSQLINPSLSGSPNDEGTLKKTPTRVKSTFSAHSIGAKTGAIGTMLAMRNHRKKDGGEEEPEELLDVMDESSILARTLNSRQQNRAVS